MSGINFFSNPELDARLEGSTLFTAPPNAKTAFYIMFNFDCDFNGIEFFAWSPNPGDNIDLTTEYNAGPYGWKRYKKFAKNINIYPNYVNKTILFPTKPKAGVRLVIYYDNKGPNPVQFSLNKFQFVTSQYVDPQQLQEGEDW